MIILYFTNEQCNKFELSFLYSALEGLLPFAAIKIFQLTQTNHLHIDGIYKLRQFYQEIYKKKGLHPSLISQDSVTKNYTNHV